MCVYCFCADWARKWVPDVDPNVPWNPQTPVPMPNIYPPPPNWPAIPMPLPQPWTRQQLDQFEELCRRIKELEDRLGGCPCEEPGKMDFLKDIRKRLDAVEEKAVTTKKKPRKTAKKVTP